MFGKFFSAVGAVCLAAVVMFGATAPAGASVTRGTNTTWSGVVSKGSGYSAARGSFVVPRASARCGVGVMSVWVGLGGFGRLPFVQNGFTITRTAVAGWYEVFDRYGNTSTVPVAIAARPGDTVSPVLTFSADHSTLRFAWRNVTRGTQVVRIVHHAQRFYNGRTAEWIAERAPYDTATDTPLLAHAPITWTHAVAFRSTTKVAAYTDHSVVLDLMSRRTGHVLERVHPQHPKSFATSFVNCR